MFRKLFYLGIAVSLITACGTTKQTTRIKEQSETKSSAPIPPEGIEFRGITDYKEFASIQVPVSGNGFSSEIQRPDQVIPSMKYRGAHFSIWRNIRDFEGTLEEQFENAKKIVNLQVKPESQVRFEKKTIGKHEVALFDIYRDLTQGYGTLNYGYLVKNGTKASLIFVREGYLTPELNVDEYRKNLEEVMQYMIQTLEFKELQ